MQFLFNKIYDSCLYKTDDGQSKAETIFMIFRMQHMSALFNNFYFKLGA